VLLAMVSLAACTAGSSRSTQVPAVVVARETPEAAALTQQLADAKRLVNDKDWPRALAALRAVVDARTFRSLPRDVQYRALAVASRVAIYHGPAKLGYEYLGRLIALPQSNYDDWLQRLRAADKLDNRADTVGTLTVMMQRWPDRTGQLNPAYIVRVINEARGLPDDKASSLLQALFAAHWKLKWGIEASAAWRDLTLLLLEKGRLPEALNVSAHVTDVYVLVAMRADRRFDAVVAASPAQFDIEAAAEREFQAFQEAADKSPQSLELKSWVINSLLRQQHYEAALAAADSVLSDIRSTIYPEKLFEDYADRVPWFLNLRSIALQRVGRWDEALTQLAAASLLSEPGGGNVDELINLGILDCALGRPRDALAAIGRVGERTSPYGAMQKEAVTLDAAVQLADEKPIERSLQYLHMHRADAPNTYEEALVIANQLHRAARVLVAQLLDTSERQDALLGVQAFAPTPGTPRDMEIDARHRAVMLRPEVQAAIQKVGRVDSYRLEAPL
jgi:hypothetical protein